MPKGSRKWARGPGSLQRPSPCLSPSLPSTLPFLHRFLSSLPSVSLSSSPRGKIATPFLPSVSPFLPSSLFFTYFLPCPPLPPFFPPFLRPFLPSFPSLLGLSPPLSSSRLSLLPFLGQHANTNVDAARLLGRERATSQFITAKKWINITKKMDHGDTKRSNYAPRMSGFSPHESLSRRKETQYKEKGCRSLVFFIFFYFVFTMTSVLTGLLLFTVQGHPAVQMKTRGTCAAKCRGFSKYWTTLVVLSWATSNLPSPPFKSQ